MNILIIASNVPIRPFSGATTRVYHLAQQWSRCHHVTLVAPVFSPVDSDTLTAYAEEMGVELYAVPIQPTTKLRHRLNYVARAIRGAPTILHYPELITFLHNLVLSHKFDVVDIEGTGFGGGLYLSAFEELASRPRVIFTFYDVLWHWWKREFIASPNIISLVRWLTYRIWEPRFVRQADCCIFVSAVDAAIVERVVKPRKTFVIPHGFEVELFEVSPVPDTREVLFVGSFWHRPNRQAAVWLIKEIWPALKRRVSDARLTIIGLNPPSDLIALADSAGVRLVGNVPDLRPYYTRTQAVIVPVQTGSGIRVKIIEAWAAARPIVTTRIGAEGLPVVPNEHALFAEGAEGLAEALARVLTDRALAQQLANNGRALVEREFSWELLAKREERAFYSMYDIRGLERYSLCGSRK